MDSYKATIQAALRTKQAPIIGHTRHGQPIYAIVGGDGTDDDTPRSVEDLVSKTPEELRRIVAVCDAKIRSLHQNDQGELRVLTDDEQTAFDTLINVRTEAIRRIDNHTRVSEILRQKPKAVEKALSSITHGTEDPYGDVRRLTTSEARDAALRRLDSRTDTAHMSAEQKGEVERQIRHNTDIAKRILVTETPEYREAWLKAVTHPQGAAMWSDDERQAMRAWEEYRAMSENTTTAGGFGIPVFIDPSIILTAQESGNPFLQLARQVPVNTNIWKGVSSAGVSWSFDTEATEVSDDSPTLAQPSVTVHMARGFIPYSLEVGQDYPAFADEMATLLASGYDELLVDKFTRGSGTGEPQGILTALSANTNVRVKVTTAGALGSPDPYKVWEALGQRFRRRASWLMSVNVNDAIRQIGTANVFHGYTVNLPENWADQLMGRPVYESPYMPNTTTTTTDTSGYAVVGDFQNYVIARRGGMSVELVPTLVGTNHRPTGQRGWFAYARIGGGSVNDLGFRLLVNT